MAGKTWTVEETQFIIDNYEENGAQFCSDKLDGRTVGAVKSRAKQLNIKSSKANSNRKWSVEEDKILIEYYPQLGAIPCIELLGDKRTRDSIVCRAGKLNLKMKNQYNKWDHARYEEELFNREIDYYPLENYINAVTPILHECLEEHKWRVTPSHVLGGTKCPSCRGTYGFKPSERAILYYIRIEHYSVVYYKIGVTNRTVEDRFFRDRNLVNIVPLLIEEYVEGTTAITREREILSKYADKRVTVPKLLLSRGNTELFIEDVLGLDTEKAQ